MAYKLAKLWWRRLNATTYWLAAFERVRLWLPSASAVFPLNYWYILMKTISAKLSCFVSVFVFLQLCHFLLFTLHMSQVRVCLCLKPLGQILAKLASKLPNNLDIHYLPRTVVQFTKQTFYYNWQSFCQELQKMLKQQHKAS